ncbi:hypothetical protein BIV57_04085 [Mangrovactinospora gilvigrisea]|uniref:Gram-positive cocci surface proteins LPxTG domain-containing protein n=1 Tax=Mangrovactinospora gilvigrisea TaxID=1428644 RepID=A0A1J7BJB9_9ACTN|nr:PT domain-containing protein [Mangrovactinospora gilvigrisea]OIV38734.1 hypothetical protein BIV57_04085 [Mangrovactinospora gilvigrisea]
MNARLKKFTAVAAVAGGLGLAQLAGAGSAFADGGEGVDLTAQLPWIVTVDGNTGAVQHGFQINYGNNGYGNGSTAHNVTMTVTGKRNISFGKPNAKEAPGWTVKSYSAHKVVLGMAQLAPTSKMGEVALQTWFSGKSQDVSVSIASDDTDVYPDNNTKSGKYTYDISGPTTKPTPSSKPTTKPTGKPTSKPSSQPTAVPSSKPTTKPEPTGSSSASAAPAPSSNGGNGTGLAETGASSQTPMIAGGAAALVVVGGGLAWFAARRRKAAN